MKRVKLPYYSMSTSSFRPSLLDRANYNLKIATSVVRTAMKIVTYT